MANPVRRFPPPWSIEELNDACFIARDADGQQLSAAKLLSKDEARRIAATKVSLAKDGEARF